MESNPRNDEVSVFKVMDAIEEAYFQTNTDQGNEGREAIAFLMGYISSELGVDSSMWLRSVQARNIKRNDI